MKAYFLIIVIVICSLSLNGQNLIGYNSDQIIKYIIKNHTDLVLETNFRNDHYKYLKFTDEITDNRTVLFFLSEKNKCTSVKMIYDLSFKRSTIIELDSLYTRVDENEWFDDTKRKDAVILLKEEDWFLTVSIKPK